MASSSKAPVIFPDNSTRMEWKDTNMRAAMEAGGKMSGEGKRKAWYKTRNHYHFNNRRGRFAREHFAIAHAKALTMVHVRKRKPPLDHVYMVIGGKGDRFHAQYGPGDHWWAMFNNAILTLPYVGPIPWSIIVLNTSIMPL